MNSLFTIKLVLKDYISKPILLSMFIILISTCLSSLVWNIEHFPSSLFIIIKQPLCPVVGQRPQHAASTSAYIALFSARWYPSSSSSSHRSSSRTFPFVWFSGGDTQCPSVISLSFPLTQMFVLSRQLYVHIYVVKRSYACVRACVHREHLLHNVKYIHRMSVYWIDKVDQ